MNLSGLHRKFVLNGRDTMDPNRVNGPTQLLSLGYIWESVPGIDTDGVSDANANQGTKTFIYVLNDSGSPITAGEACIRATGPAVAKIYDVEAVSVAFAYPGTCVGICVTPIADGEYGFLQRTGLIEDLIDTSGLTVATAVALTGVGGAYADAAPGILGIGYTVVSDATNGAIFLDCRG